jgi:hypothetical protein
MIVIDARLTAVIASCAVVAASLLVGCAAPSATPAAVSPTSPTAAPTAPAAPIATAAPGQQVSMADLQPQLNALWRGVDKGAQPKDRPGIAWSMRTTPAFPTAWPPTATTIWVRYAYAAGRDLGGGLADGERVARPWARVELRPGAATAAIVPLSARLEPLAIQGVRPIDAATAARLRQEEQITAACLRLTGPPDPAAAETADLRAFYRAWLGFNGVIADAIRADHGAFLDWIGQ